MANVQVKDPMRRNYRPLSDREQHDIQVVKQKGEELYRLYERMGNTRYANMAKTALEESVLWATKGISGGEVLDQAPLPPDSEREAGN